MENRGYGELIYTANSGSDGSLGGLVKQGDVHHFEPILKEAIRESQWCSSDPLCINSNGQGFNSLNVSACHACLLVSETSCEERNLLLDRGTLVGTPENPELGYFNSINLNI